MTLPLQIQKRKNYLTFVDDRLKFPYIMGNMCKKASLKLSGLSCLAPICRSITKENFIQSVFSVTVWLLAWICYSRIPNNKIK